MSTEQQHAKLRDAFAAFKTIKPSWSDAVFGEFFADEATCRESKFWQRHSGSLLVAASAPGDVILVSNYDRIFANVVDVCETLQLLKERGVGLIILDSDIDTTTIVGEFCFKVLALVKEMEVKEIRRRVKENLDHRKRIGRPYSGKRPIGWKYKVVHVPGVVGAQRYLQPDNASRRRAREILRIRIKGNLSYDQASQYCNSIGLKQKNGHRWTKPTFRAWCKAAKNDFVLSNGSHVPAPMPANATPVLIETINPDD